MKKTLFTLSILLSASAYAGQGVYVGATLGESNTTNGSNTAAWNNSSYNGVYGGLVGYQFNQNFAVEGAYTGAGKFGNNTVNGKSDILTLDAVGLIPFSSNFSLYGKLGMGSATTKSVNSNTPGYSGATRSAVTYGVGIQMEATRNISARLGYDSYRSAINTPAGSGNFDSNVFSVGALYHF
ncbi:MAG: porin family protein [Ferrovum sp.]|nr:porin family protein [Ferrovum sp.]NDU88157.1 porin family protein [Ferrovum sp.]